MPISNTQVRVSYMGDGASTQFAIPFPFYLDTDITVTLGTAVQGSGYSITGGEDAHSNPQTGTVIFSSAPATGVAVQFILDVPLTQLVDLVDGTAFSSATLNQVNDRAIQSALRLSDRLDRAIIAPDGDVSPNLSLPAASTRASTFLGFDTNGNLSLGQTLPSGTLSQATIGLFLNPHSDAEIAAGVTPTNYAYPPLDARRYGADPTGVSASDTAFNNGVAVLSKIPGGTLLFPAGLYSFATANTVLNSKSGIVIQGAGSPSAGLQPGTRFQFTSAGTGVWFAFNGAQGVQFRGIQFVHTQVGFTGTYLQCNNTTGTDPANCGIYDCTLGTNVGNVLHLDLNKCIDFSCDRCVFQYYGANGSVRGAQAGGYANNISFRSCEWFNGAAAPIQNAGPHQGWSFIGCTFEGLAQLINQPAAAILSTANTGTWAGLIVEGSWFGDAGTASGVWVDGYFDGAVFQGNYISGNQTGTIAFNFRNSVGVALHGNALTALLTAINFATATNQSFTVRGNVNLGSITNPWANTSNILLGTFDWGANFGFGVPSGHGAPVNINGYRVYPDATGGTAQGEIEQWGVSTVSAASGTITITSSTGLAFPNICNNVVGNISASSNSNGLYLTPNGVNFTYTITGTMPASVTFSWRAVGN